MMSSVRSTRHAGTGDKSPIFIPGKGAGVLCLHGFTGTPYEIAPLARALGAAGFAVSAPMLAGHGESALALAATRWPDWLASAEAALDRLRHGAYRVVLDGEIYRAPRPFPEEIKKALAKGGEKA